MRNPYGDFSHLTYTTYHAKEEQTMTEKLKKIISRLRNYTTSELCDGAVDYHTMDYHIRRQVSDKNIVGPAFTINPPKGISGIIPDAILQAEEGDVLVVAGQGFGAGSYWGDHRSICANMKGLAGIVIDGAFRDLKGCQEAGFPVFARNVTPGSADKAREGELNVPVICGGVKVCPGDLIIGDCNGVLVIKPEDAEAIMERADAKIKAEQYTIWQMKETGEILPRVIRP